MAKVAVDRVRSGDTLILDSGPICAELARQLAGRTDVSCTVITRSLDAIAALKAASHVTFIALGGVLDRTD